MSYLNNVHMVFAGLFQADTSTVNNDVTHYNNKTFEPRFQQYQTQQHYNGWWNPCGSGAFRLIDCKVTRVGYADGTTVNEKASDPVIGMLIGGSNEQTSAKIVDLDPQMQMVSELWGLTMRLTDGQTPGFFAGKYKPAPFKDILFQRSVTGGGDEAATAIYQSVLEDLSWVDENSSTFLQQLKQASQQTGKLSVRMMVYNYHGDHTEEEFTLGKVVGIIGPAFENEPDSFILGRRFAPPANQVNPQNINFFNAQFNSNPDFSGVLCTDLSNALPFNTPDGQFTDLGQLQLVMLSGDLPAGTTNLSPSLYTKLGSPIPYLEPNWMNDTGGVVFANIDSSTGQSLVGNPLALMKLEDSSILIRETENGILVRAEQVVHRLNPPQTTTVDFYSSQFGNPTPLQVSVKLDKPGQGTSPGPKSPFINHPPSAIIYDKSFTTDQNGKGTMSFSVTDPNNPRGYVDGQLYFLNYTPTNYPNYSQYMFDQVMSHVYDNFDVPETPTWDDVKDFMTQYGNLYPVMSRMLVDLGNYQSVIKYRSLLELAFGLPESDSNYMPVTRDLSEGKRQTMLKWLTAQDSQGNYTLAPGNGDISAPPNDEPCQSCEIDTDVNTVGDQSSPDNTAPQPDCDSKSAAHRHFVQQRNNKEV